MLEDEEPDQIPRVGGGGGVLIKLTPQGSCSSWISKEVHKWT